MILLHKTRPSIPIRETKFPFIVLRALPTLVAITYSPCQIIEGREH